MKPVVIGVGGFAIGLTASVLLGVAIFLRKLVQGDDTLEELPTSYTADEPRPLVWGGVPHRPVGVTKLDGSTHWFSG